MNLQILIISFFISFLFNQNFNINQYFGTLNINGKNYDEPFLGGFNKPKVQWLDWDYDNDEDLFLLDENGTIKLYINNSNENYIKFDLYDSSLFDINGIGWFYIGNFDSDNDFELITQDKMNIDQMIFYDISDNTIIEVGTLYDVISIPLQSDPVMFPTFIDIDNDGDLDFFTGNIIGTVTFYENIGFEIDRPQFQLVTTFWEDIYIVGPSNQRHGASAINFVDIDNDNDYDLAWGDFFQQSLYIIENIGNSSNPIMDDINISTQFPPGDPIISAGLNMPSFTDIDNDGDEDLFVTVLSGAYGYQLINNFYFYRNENGSYNLESQEFIETLDLFSDIYPEFIDIDSDGDLDLFIGTATDLSEFPINGKVKFYENIGNDSNLEPIWNLVNSEFLGGNAGYNLSLDFGDIDADGDYDMLVGEYNGTIRIYLNAGDEFEPNFSEYSLINDIDLSGNSIPKLIDIDNDLDLDLFIGQSTGNISFYENIGSNENYDFILVSSNYNDISVSNKSSIDFFDIDNDEDYDLIVGSQYENIFFYENIGDSYEPDFQFDSSKVFPTLGFNLVPAFISHNQQKKLLVGTSTGGAYLVDLEFCSNYGDYNNDTIINVIDIVYLVNVIINNNSVYNNCTFDLNGDNEINVSDILILVNSIIM